ncbi:MAG TPA: Trm112 family protein [Bacteroidetes bacterium]|nr:Trm112 family protein [Bacteroidota bacterium]
MKKEMIDFLCCPTCKSDLKLEIVKEDKDEIIKGVFTCKKCNTKYYIENGIPHLLPK